MPKRSTSKNRAAELEKEIDMENKEATPVEDMEITLPPVSYTHLYTAMHEKLPPQAIQEIIEFPTRKEYKFDQMRFYNK